MVVKASGSQPEWATYANKSVLQRLDPEPVTLDATVFPQRIAKNTLHAIEVRRQGGRFWVELDGKPLLSARDVTFDKVHFAVRHFYSEVREVRVKLFSYIGALEPPRKKD